MYELILTRQLFFKKRTPDDFDILRYHSYQICYYKCECHAVFFIHDCMLVYCYVTGLMNISSNKSSNMQRKMLLGSEFWNFKVLYWASGNEFHWFVGGSRLINLEQTDWLNCKKKYYYRANGQYDQHDFKNIFIE